MATIIKTWATAVVLAITDFYGGSVAGLAADQKYDYTADIDLETAGQEGAHVTIGFKGSNSTNDLVVDVFASLDGTTYDTEPFMHLLLSNDGSPRQQSIIVNDVAHFRLGLKSTGTDTTFDYSVTHQRWLLTNA